MILPRKVTLALGSEFSFPEKLMSPGFIILFSGNLVLSLITQPVARHVSGAMSKFRLRISLESWSPRGPRLESGSSLHSGPKYCLPRHLSPRSPRILFPGRKDYRELASEKNKRRVNSLYLSWLGLGEGTERTH